MKKWTKEETDILVLCGDIMSPKEISARTGRSISAVHNKASKLKVTCKRKFENVTWTKKEEQMIRDLAGSTCAKELAKKLGKSHTALKHKASRMGVSLRTIKWTDRQLDLLFQYKQEGMSYKDIAKRLKKSANACKCKWAYLKP